MKKNFKNVRNLVRRGIPDPLRGMVWQLLAGPHDEELKKKYPLLIIVSITEDDINNLITLIIIGVMPF